MKCWMLAAVFLLLATGAPAFMEGGCGAGECTDCHSLGKQEAQDLLKNLGGEIKNVEQAEMPGLWLVEIEKDGKIYPLYIDYSKSFMVAGNIVRIADRQDLTRQRFLERNPVDVSRIPLEDALLVGRADARTKIIVFTDPRCPYCKRLHEELKEAVRRDPQVAFLIKLFPLKIHPDAYQIAKSIVCSKSLQMLEDSFAGKQVPILPCEAPAVDQTLKLAPELGINSTPTMVLPNGRLVPGYRSADQILALLKEKHQAAGTKK